MKPYEQVLVRYPASFYEIATELNANINKHFISHSGNFIGSFKEETGIFYHWEFNCEETSYNVKVEKDPYKVTPKTQTHSIWFRDMGTAKWYLSHIKELQTINVVKDMEEE
jgi:hypothetical protein